MMRAAMIAKIVPVSRLLISLNAHEKAAPDVELPSSAFR
jgi:hypothetical protein